MLALKNKLLEMNLGKTFIEEFLIYLESKKIDIKCIEDLEKEIDTYEALFSKENNNYVDLDSNSSYDAISTQEQQYNGDSFEVGGYSLEYDNKRY